MALKFDTGRVVGGKKGVETYTQHKIYLFNFDLHYFTGVTAFSHCLFTPHFSENITLFKVFHTFGPEIALNPHGLTLSTGGGGLGAPEGRVHLPKV